MSADRALYKLGISPLAGAVLALLTLLILGQALAAYKDEFLTVSQMRQRGIDRGLPFVWHFAMWSDLLLISPLAAYLVNRYWNVRRSVWIGASLVVGFASSAALHYLYTFSAIPEAHVQNNQLTPAGWLHLVYMAFAIAAFWQFLVFTYEVTHKILGVVSILLLLHVFAGTHMSLGIFNLYFPQDWYPGQPLKSFIGWATIVCLALALLWRNYYEIDRKERWPEIEAFPARHPFLKKLIVAFEMWTLHGFETTERYLKALDYIASYVGVSAFTAVFLAKLQMSTEFNGGILRFENWVYFFKTSALPTFLIFLFGAIYLLGRHSVRMELTLGAKLFPPGLAPTDWGTSKVRVVVFGTVIAHLVLFLSLAWFADNIMVASLIMLITAVNDWRTRYLIGDGIERYFSEPKYAPKAGDKDYAVIMERRKVAWRFLFERPHLPKETARVLGCGLASGLSLYGYFNGVALFDFAAYVVLITTLIINEFVTVRWRIKMMLEMREIEDKKKQLEAQAPAVA